MPNETPESPTCALCGRSFLLRETIACGALAPALIASIASRGALLPPDARICRACLFDERTAALLDRLAAERGELSQIERVVAEKASRHVTIAADIEADFARTATVADRAADAVARVGGSWKFVIGLLGLLFVWMIINTLLAARALDPFPFILLNLGLSCIAALQAPIILMSANRQARLDRRKADQDFLVNLKAELEVASLHEKLDHLLHTQWEQLLEVQELQIEMLRTLVERDGAPIRRDGVSAGAPR